MIRFDEVRQAMLSGALRIVNFIVLGAGAVVVALQIAGAVDASTANWVVPAVCGCFLVGAVKARRARRQVGDTAS